MILNPIYLVIGIDVTNNESFIAMKIRSIKENCGLVKEIIKAITHQSRLIRFSSGKQTYFS